MRACLQRVRRASVAVDGRVVGRISHGLLILLGVGQHDTREDVAYLCDKILQLRLFEDEQGKMNRSVKDVGGELLVVSQFTLYGDCRRGRRPSFSHAAPPDLAADLFAAFVDQLQQTGVPVAQGVFRAHMNVELVNDGPVTLLLESRGHEGGW